jgi:hypothetical protein
VEAEIYSGVWLPTAKREGRRRDGQGEGPSVWAGLGNKARASPISSWQIKPRRSEMRALLSEQAQVRSGTLLHDL